jgi:hypothetical protein
MPVLLYLSGVVIILAFPPLKVRALRLELKKISSLRSDTKYCFWVWVVL